MQKTLLSRLSAPSALTLAIAAAFFAAAPAGAAVPGAAADARLKDIYTREWAWRQTQGLAGIEGETVSDSLPKVDAATQQARLDYWANVLRQLDAIAAQQLSPDARIDYAVYRAQIEALLRAQQFHEYEKPLNADSAFWSDMADGARRSFSSGAEYTRFIAWMSDVPRYFREESENMRAGLRRGFTPPKVTLAGRDASLASVADAAAAQDTVFYTPFKSMPASMPAQEQERLRAAGLKAIREAVMPAYAALLAFMRGDYMPHASEALAAESLPDGKAYYQSKIVEFTTTNLSAAQIHAIGLAEMARIHVEMQATIGQTGFKGDFPAFLQFLRSDPQFYAKTPQELLMHAAYSAKQFDGKAEHYFGYLPRRRFGIVPVPATRRRSTPRAAAVPANTW